MRMNTRTRLIYVWEIVSILDSLQNEGEKQMKEYNPNGLSAFFALIHSGVLQIEYVENLTYCFFNVPGYVFLVNDFNRKGINSGWLISSYKQCNKIEKIDYWNNLINNINNKK